jgi:hypothetical protein
MNQYKMTYHRMRWLMKLRDEGIAVRSNNRVGFDCMQAGWTEWNWFDEKTGDALTWKEAQDRYGDEDSETFWKHISASGERLTDKGYYALRNYLEQMGHA